MNAHKTKCTYVTLLFFVMLNKSTCRTNDYEEYLLEFATDSSLCTLKW